ncbi:MAG TPA: hypothetical protein VMX16_08735 [Terriglobia bacterium]|nr:hypothetical protein [Terriglobia bacterium]
MKSKIAAALMLALFLGPRLSKADFKYTQSSKMTGGMMAGAMKMMSHFSKQLREPMVSTTYFKGNRMRRESPDGTVEIIDLASQRIIQINTKKQAYSVMTFEQMRQALANMQQKMQQEMHQQKGQQNVQLQMKVHVIPTNQTQQLLGQVAQEMKIEADMVMQGQDPNHPAAGPQSATMQMGVDSWIAPHVAGYQEVQAFYVQMAKLMNWTPNMTPMMDPRMSKAMVDLAKSGKLPVGLPLLQTINFGMAGMPPAGNGASPQANSNSQSQDSQSSNQASSPQAAAGKVIGGMFGGFGRFGHKKKQQDDSQTNNGNSPPPQGAASSPGTASLMEMTVQVTSFSSGSVDSSLFEIPAGYKQIQPDPNRPLGGPR